MRILIATLLLLSFCVPSYAEFGSQEEFGSWLMSYYQNPTPNSVPSAVEYMSNSGILDNQNAITPMFGFLSGIFSNNPDLIKPWVAQFDSIQESHLGVVVLGLWYSDLPNAKEITYSIIYKHQNLKDQFAYLNSGSPVALKSIPLEQGPWVLDALWGNFMATGNKEPVVRIFTALPWIDIKGDINRLTVGGAANWSLTSNAFQHDRVLEICESELEKQPKDIAEKLVQVIENAKAEREKSLTKK